MNIKIINYGAGNIKSIQFACKRLGYNAQLTNNPEALMQADKIIFPGVGAAKPAMQALKTSGLDVLIPQLQQPVLGICLGMQLMCNYTEEGDTEGLQIFNVNVSQFSKHLKVPHMGWNTIRNLSGKLFNTIPQQSHMYLVHSYYANVCNQTIATTNYNVNFSSALAYKNFYGVQFHPEKSGALGQQVLNNFINL